MTEKKDKTEKPRCQTPALPRAYVTLLNQGRRPLTLMLFHDQVCKRGGRCFCRDGKPKSIHLPVGVRVENQDAAVLLCDDAKLAGTAIKQIPVTMLSYEEEMAMRMEQAELGRQPADTRIKESEKRAKAKAKAAKKGKGTEEDKGKGAATEGGKS